MSGIPDSVAPSQPLPSGTVTFVFTDIEGSTKRWERNPAAMQEAVRRHDLLVRAALTLHGGRVFKTVGDAFCAAFARPEDAVAAVLDAQRALVAEDFSAVDGLRVRAAIHTGSADERDGDYFGPVVNRAARLLAIGHGGQVLVSGVTSELTEDVLPASAALRNLGEHRLKDLARPEQVHQLLAAGLEPDFPPLLSLNVLPNNLPAQLTSFIGRDREVSEISALLDAHRLVTLVGSGGIGKTRTSLQVAANLLDGSGDGVWFIELAPLSSGEYVSSTVAQALGIGLASDGDPVENLERALRSKHALLVFDNCEHIVESTAEVIAALLQSSPKIKVLATSRQALGISGEQTYTLPSLEVPTKDCAGNVKASDVVQCAAIALFVDRARAGDNRFVPTDENAPIIADICRRLDGIPLAIELAAARVKILSPRQLRERLDERFALLTGGSRNVLPRQQTLRALIDWSHDLLEERERKLFRRLGIFVNGFTFDGATAVGTDEGADEPEIFDALASLVDKSLVLAEPTGEVQRYRLLESTRMYALEKLVAAGEHDASALRHLIFLHRRFLEERGRFEKTARGAGMDESLTTELEDVRAALDRALRGSDMVLGGELLAEIGRTWQNLGLDAEGLRRAEAFLAALPEAKSRLLARLWIPVAHLSGFSGRTARELEASTKAVAQARTCGDGPTLAEALDAYSLAVAQLHRFGQAEAALAEAEAIPDVSAALRLRLLQTRAFVSSHSGDQETSARAFDRLCKENRFLGNKQAEHRMALNLAEVEHARGRTERAIAIVREVLPEFRTQNDRNLWVPVLGNLAGYLVAVNDLSGACNAARESIELATREPEAASVADAIEHLALALALATEFPRAATLAGYADAALRREGREREFTEATTHNRLNAVLADGLSPDDLTRRLGEGAALSPEAAVNLALEG